MDPTKELFDFMRWVSRKHSLLQKTQACGCGTTMAQSQALMEIGYAGEISLIQLANILGLDRSTMSRTVNNLVELGHVDRIEDCSDRRYVVLRLTDKGQEIFGQLEEEIQEHYTQVLQKVPQAKRGQVLESVRLLTEALMERKCNCGNPNCTCGCQDK